jgi:hypothetical protein
MSIFCLEGGGFYLLGKTKKNRHKKSKKNGGRATKTPVAPVTAIRARETSTTCAPFEPSFFSWPLAK